MENAETLRVTKIEAARRLGVSQRTIDRMIQRGELETERETHGRRRVLVILNAEELEGDTTLDGTDHVALREELAAARARVRSLEELSEYHREQLTMAEGRNQDLVQLLQSNQETIDRLTLALPAASQQEEARPWWRFW